jgi:serine/threonine protein phosphatase PrpC
LATKQLRLEVAQLTDVGRKREHNEDNMAYVIPKDQQVMAKKGALFIVADGMGGHAAGEVASEIAVDTVSNVYYQDDSDEIALSLLHAIKRANALIHQRAAENMLRSGMGTTCVAAVLRGNKAYIANVGDSRAYLVRNGQVKQVSQDHSWVAEQVRAGLLNDDQARTHAQRNVITRCLGTQAEVEIDVFHEQIEDKDALVLCTDGLSGLVSDDEIRGIVDQSGPQDSVYHLVQRANENGGPDNITAIVVSIQEVGWEPPNVRRPVPVGGREIGEDTAIIGMTTGAPAAATVIGDGRISSSSLRFSSGPLTPDDIITAPQPVLTTQRKRRNRLFYPLIALLTLVVLATVGGGIYFFEQITTGNRVEQHVQDAKSTIRQANQKVATNPAATLNDLAKTQSALQALLHDPSLNNAQRNSIAGLLDSDLTNSVQAAIVSYNKQASITLLCSSIVSTNAITSGTTGTQAKTIAQVTGKVNGINTSTIYALGNDNKVYQVDNNSLLLVSLPINADARVLAIASSGTQLALLTAQPMKAGAATTNDSYTVSLLSPGQGKPEHPAIDASTQINPRLIQAGQIPKLIAASGSDVYVVFGANTAQTVTHILDFSPKAGRPLVPTTESTFSSSDTIISVAAFPNHELFFLHLGGSVQSLQLAAGSQNSTETSVLLDQPIKDPLAVDAKFVAPTPVPTVTQGGTNSLGIPGAFSSSALAVGTVNGELHLYIMDAAVHRVLDLKPLGGGSSGTPTTGVTATPTNTGGGVANSAVTLQLEQQYVSSSLFVQPRSMAVDTPGSNIDVLSQNNVSPLTLVSFQTNPQNSCA